MTDFKIWALLGVIFICASAFAQEVRPAASALNEDSVYKSHSNKLPDVCFFPREKAFWDGYRVTNKNWEQLTDDQKTRFIAEGIEEIQRNETLFVAIPDKERLLTSMNAMVGQTEQSLPEADLRMIKILHDLIIQSAFTKELSDEKVSKTDFDSQIQTSVLK
jgi:hypothetical protein